MANSIDLATVAPRAFAARLERVTGRAAQSFALACVIKTAHSRQHEGGAAVAGETAVNRAQMATAATQIEEAVGTIRAQQSQLNGFHDSLKGSWQGEASNAFTAAYESFSADFTKVINALEGMHERLVGTHTRYVATEQANTQISNRISNALNR